MLFRLTKDDFELEQQQFRDQDRGTDILPLVTLNDLTPEEWTIVNMVRESAGSHGCVLPEESPVARLCSAPKPKPTKEAFRTHPRASPAKRRGR